MQDLLKWKQAVFAMDRLKEARHRAPTSTRLRQVISMVYGYAVNIRGEKGIEMLVQRLVAGGYIEWCLNEREIQGQTLQRNLRLLAAVFNQHPRFKGGDWSWTKPLLDSIPIEPESATKRRKAEKYLDYGALETIPEKIRTGRSAAAKKSPKAVALMVRDELLIKWLTILPWGSETSASAESMVLNPTSSKHRYRTSKYWNCPPGPVVLLPPEHARNLVDPKLDGVS